MSAPPRERSRPSAPSSTPAAPPTTPTAARRSRRHAAPQPPWGSFPLVELCALAAIVLGLWGILRGGRGGAVLLTAAALLGSVAGLEVALREHLGGYRSHTLVLSALGGVATLTLLLLAGVARTASFALAAGVLLSAFVVLRQLFKRRSGGVAVRVR